MTILQFKINGNPKILEHLQLFNKSICCCNCVCGALMLTYSLIISNLWIEYQKISQIKLRKKLWKYEWIPSRKRIQLEFKEITSRDIRSTAILLRDTSTDRNKTKSTETRRQWKSRIERLIQVDSRVVIILLNLLCSGSEWSRKFYIRMLFIAQKTTNNGDDKANKSLFCAAVYTVLIFKREYHLILYQLSLVALFSQFTRHCREIPFNHLFHFCVLHVNLRSRYLKGHQRIFV